ncbi:hypothetical protein SAMN02745910_05182, partial [Priestia endophytica DSM 13796]
MAPFNKKIAIFGASAIAATGIGIGAYALTNSSSEQASTSSNETVDSEQNNEKNTSKETDKKQEKNNELEGQDFEFDLDDNQDDELFDDIAQRATEASDTKENYAYVFDYDKKEDKAEETQYVFTNIEDLNPEVKKDGTFAFTEEQKQDTNKDVLLASADPLEIADKTEPQLKDIVIKNPHQVPAEKQTNETPAPEQPGAENPGNETPAPEQPG